MSIQGRTLRDEDLQQIQGLLVEQPSWHRTRISRELCVRWGWRNQAGRLKDMACRTLLLKLEERGLIRLPPRRRPSVNGHRNRHAPEPPVEGAALHASLQSLLPLRVDPVAPGTPEARLFHLLLQRHHYLGHHNCVGENLRYLARACDGSPVACLLFGSAAWHCQSRDAFIGWTPAERRRGLPLLTNNTRFLILPWVHVAHLASHLLGGIARRLSRDWQQKYGHPIHLLESFVQRDRFVGTAYRAAGWSRVGATTGRSRNAPGHAPQVAVKEVYLRALSADFRQRFGA